MQKLILTALFLSIIHNVFGQNKLQYQINYTFFHVVDTTTNKIYREEMCLQLASEESVYFSLSNQEQQRQINQRMEAQLREGGNLELGKITTYNKQFLHWNYEKHEFAAENPFQRKVYIFKYKQPTITWTLHDSTKSFGNLPCQKATASFGGRNYIAWFSQTIPVPAGPWKLHGLPGAIVEAYDDQRQVQFLFNGLVSSFSPHVAASDPMYVTSDQFYAMLDAQRMQAGSSNGGINFTVTPGSNSPSIRSGSGGNPLIRTKQ